MKRLILVLLLIFSTTCSARDWVFVTRTSKNGEMYIDNDTIIHHKGNIGITLVVNPSAPLEGRVQSIVSSMGMSCKEPKAVLVDIEFYTGKFGKGVQLKPAAGEETTKAFVFEKDSIYAVLQKELCN